MYCTCKRHFHEEFVTARCKGKIPFYLVVTKILESIFSGKTNLDKQLQDNIWKVQDSAFYPQGVMAHYPQGVIAKSGVRHGTAMFYADTSKSQLIKVI